MGQKCWQMTPDNNYNKCEERKKPWHTHTQTHNRNVRFNEMSPIGNVVLHLSMITDFRYFNCTEYEYGPFCRVFLDRLFHPFPRVHQAGQRDQYRPNVSFINRKRNRRGTNITNQTLNI